MRRVVPDPADRIGRHEAVDVDHAGAFQRDRLPLLDDLRAQVEDGVAARGEAAYSAQLKKFAVDLRTKDFSASKLEDLLEQYKLAVVP